MKIIHIVGYSNSGKTTFIAKLLKLLNNMGTVAVVKHLGHHAATLEKGKDTTIFYEHGAAISIGIDDEKAIAAIRKSNLERTLEMLCDMGMDYTIIEGFKKQPFPKVILGDLELEGAVLHNPEPENVIDSIDAFEDFYTLQGLVHELKKEHDVSRAGAILTFNGIVREWTGDTQTEYMDFDDDIEGLLSDIKDEIAQVPGILGVRFYHRKGRLYAGDDITYIAILAAHRQEAFAAASNAIDRLKRELHDAEDK
jgi:molybdopterin synthase catalytic subunit